ncbi:MAG: hypothetical protein FJ319_12020 [SAR202 cluster bacterium]|nr:hypothetical protein [SAR202 cluster bacterium]
MLGRIFPTFTSWARSAYEALPPHRKVEGVLTSRETSAVGKHFITVGGHRVEVDWLTFDTLKEGESLTVRCSRSYKAIQIERIKNLVE